MTHTARFVYHIN